MNSFSKKFLAKKEKIKKIKKLEREIDEEQYKEDIQYRDHKLNQPKVKEKKDPYLFGMPDLDNIDRLNKQEEKIIRRDSEFEVHRLRSLRNLEDYITDYFTMNKRSILISDLIHNFAERSSLRKLDKKGYKK